MILLLLDNHESYCTIDAIQFCRENGIILLTFSPHSSTSLGIAVMRSFKQRLSIAQNDWLLNHPRKTIIIHDLTGIVTPPYNAAFTPNNIISGFSKSGIYPFNINAFIDEECAEVTNRPLTKSISTVPIDQGCSNANVYTNESSLMIVDVPSPIESQII